MKRLVLTLAALALLAAAPAANASKHLPMSTTLQLKLMAADHSQTNQAGYPAIACTRRSPIKIRCAGTAEQTVGRDIHRCEYVGFVTNRKTAKRKKGKRVVRWKPSYRLTTAKCSTTPKPYLEEADAISAIGAQGVAEYGANVTLQQLKRMSDTQYVGWVSWTEPSPSDPWGPPLFFCEADYTADLLGPDQIRVAFENQQCSF